MATKKRINAAGYARRSTDMQERSIPDQKAYLEKWAKENGYHIRHWYIDDAISGTSTKGRKAFESMIADAENGRDFETVLCYDISRFSRGGTNETGYYLYRLQMAGVDAIFPADGIVDGDEGELLQGVKSWQAKQYTVKLSRDVIRGFISNITIRHSAPGGIAAYGYDKQHQTAKGQVLRTFRWLADGRKQEFSPDGKLVRILESNEFVKKAKSDIVRFVPSTPERVEVVKQVFEMYLAGHGQHHIASQLNQDGISSYNGTYWDIGKIKRMLENPIYKGAIVWNRRTVGRFNGVDGKGNLRPKRSRYDKKNPQEDWYLVENIHEQLVSADDWEKAQQIRAKRRYMGGQAKTSGRSLLSGLIKCDNCKRNYIKKYVNYNHKGVSKRYHYYTDGGYFRGGKAVCKLTNIPMEPLEQWVLQHIKRILIGDHKTVKQAVNAFVKKVLSSRKKPDNTSGLKNELEATNRRIKATVGMLADPMFDGLDELKNTLVELKGRRDRLQKKLETAKPDTAAAFRESDLRKWALEKLSALEKYVFAPTVPVEMRNVVNACISRIVIDPYAKQGVLYIPKDTYGLFYNDFCNKGAHGDKRASIKMKGQA